VTELAQGVCPDGWHIPTDAQQYVLENYLKDPGQSCVAGRNGWECDTAGSKLQVGGTSHFEGILAGYRDIGGGWGYQGFTVDFWSSTISGPGAWDRTLDVRNASVRRILLDQAYGLSVRCLQD